MPRLDVIVVMRQLAPTRSRALDLIRRGFVTVNGAAITKAGAEIAADAAITLAPSAPGYVSRGAEKLVAGLERFQFNVAGMRAVDIGASTGGFTEVLLARGAAHVTAVDVGTGQLHAILRADARVTVREGTDARALTGADFPIRPEAIVSDVSFISLEKALPAVLRLAVPGAWLIALIKPQFEVGRENVGKGGIVRSAALRDRAVERIGAWLDSSGWRVVASVASPITGSDGNQEFLMGAVKNRGAPATPGG